MLVASLTLRKNISNPESGCYFPPPYRVVFERRQVSFFPPIDTVSKINVIPNNVDNCDIDLLHANLNLHS